MCWDDSMEIKIKIEKTKATINKMDQVLNNLRLNQTSWKTCCTEGFARSNDKYGY